MHDTVHYIEPRLASTMSVTWHDDSRTETTAKQASKQASKQANISHTTFTYNVQFTHSLHQTEDQSESNY